MLVDLMHKNTQIALVYFGNYDFHLEKSYVDIFPVRNDAELHKWFQNRQTPYSRDNMMEVYKFCNIKDEKDLIESTHFLSVNDCFWFRLKDSETWESQNLFNRSFSSFVSDLCFLAKPITNKFDDKHIYSPEFVNGGSFPKTWRHRNNEIYLIKGGDINNVMSEVLVNEIQDYLGIQNYVKYKYTKYKGYDVCISKCFSNEDIEFYPFVYFISGYPSYEEIKPYFEEYEEFYQMLLVDCVVCNIDRHTGNYGYLYKNGVKIGMAPIFDNNWALFPREELSKMTRNKFVELNNNYVSRLNNEPFISLGRKILKDYPIGKSLLRSMNMFHFKQKTIRNKALEKFIHAQSKLILNEGI